MEHEVKEENSGVGDRIWGNRSFGLLYSAHLVNLVGASLTSVALGLLANFLVGASAAQVIGFVLAIRIFVIVLASPWAGQVSAWLGPRATMITCDLIRALVVAGFLFVDSVWQIYVLAFFLNLGSSLYTPVYKAVIPEVVSRKSYPKAVAYGLVAYDVANILGPMLAGLAILLVGFQGNFILNALGFVVSALLIFWVPRRLAPTVGAGDKSGKSPVRPRSLDGIKAMLKRPSLRQTLYLSFQVSVAGAFVLVATVNLIKVVLDRPDADLAWPMAAYGFGSVFGALFYSRARPEVRDRWFGMAGPLMLVGLLATGGLVLYGSPGLAFFGVHVTWILVGAGQSTIGVRSNELLVAYSEGGERPHIFAAHFALSHAAWGVTYLLAGWWATSLGFGTAALAFGGLFLAVAGPLWLFSPRRLRAVPVVD